MAEIQNIPLNEALKISNPKVNQNFKNINEQLEGHINSNTAHAAKSITYNGAVTGAENAQEAIDSIKESLDEAIITGDSGPEAAAARYSTPYETSYPTLKDRLDATDKRQKDVHYIVELSEADGVVDNTTEIKAIVSDMSVLGGTIFFPRGLYRFTSNTTFPSNLTLSFQEGAILSPDSGVTLTINSQIEAGLFQIFGGDGIIAGDKRNDYVFPQWWGVKGNNTDDDRPAMQKAIEAAQYSKDTLFVPYSPGYKFIGGLVIQNPCTIICDQTAVFYFTLQNSTDAAIKIQYNYNQGYYQFPLLTGNKVGIGIQIVNANVMRVECKYINFFEDGLHMWAKDRACENNYIDIDIIENVYRGIVLEGTGHYCDIHQFFINTIALCRYGVVFKESNGGKVADNWMLICQLWTEIDDGVCFYTEAGAIPLRNTIEVQYLASHSTAGQTVPYVGSPSVGTNGRYFSGADLQKAENMFVGNNNFFKLGFIRPNTSTKMYIKGYDNRIDPLVTMSSGSAGSSYGTPQTSSNSEAAFGLPSYFRKTLIRLSVPPGSAGAQIDRYVYHQFCSHTFAKMVQVIPANGYGVNFFIWAEDVSYNNNREIVIHIRYLQTTSAAQNADFYILFE